MIKDFGTANGTLIKTLMTEFKVCAAHKMFQKTFSHKRLISVPLAVSNLPDPNATTFQNMKPEDFDPPEEDQPFAQEGYAIMAAAFEVHREIHGGLLEEIYQESLEEELRLRNLPFVAKQKLAVFYKGRQLKKRMSQIFMSSERSLLS